MLSDKLNKLPPIVCRMLARKGHSTPRTVEEIMAISGLSKRTVVRLSKRDRWDRVPVGVVDRFMLGCGIKFEQMGKHIAYLRDTLRKENKFAHIKRKETKNYLGNLLLKALCQNPTSILVQSNVSSVSPNGAASSAKPPTARPSSSKRPSARSVRAS